MIKRHNSKLNQALPYILKDRRIQRVPNSASGSEKPGQVQNFHFKNKSLTKTLSNLKTVNPTLSGGIDPMRFW
jgi:hypothetical protein